MSSDAYGASGVERRAALRQLLLSSMAAENAGGARNALDGKLAAVLASVAERDFPAQWPGLVDDLSRLSDAAAGRGAALALATLGTMADDCSDSDFNARLSPR